MPTNLKPIQPVYFNLKHKEDKEFWDDIHSDQIPNFTRWVKYQWLIWKQSTQQNTDIIINQFKKIEEIKETVIKTQESKSTVQSEIFGTPSRQEKPKSINVSSLTKMFGIKTI